MKYSTIISFIKKKPSMSIALFFIIVVILVAIFAYSLATDKTKNANQMVVELAAKPPGFKTKLLKVEKKKTKKDETKNAVKDFFLGTESDYNYIPVNKIWLQGDRVAAEHFIDDGISDTLLFEKSEIGIAQSKALDIYEVQKKAIQEKKFILGTDRYGRDIYSRLIVGTRVSLAVGLVSVVLSLSIGLFLGSIAGWYSGWIDNLVMYIVNIMWSIPTLLLVFAITITIGKGFWEVFIAIGLTSWVGAARLIRGQVMQLKNLDFIAAAKVMGYSDFRIIFKHILPNISGPLMVIAATNFAAAILTEAGLSFLGIGVQPPTPSWGLMIKEHYNFLIAGIPMIALIPGLAIMLVVLAFNVLGNGLRDLIDVKE